MTADRLPPIETDPLGAIRTELLSAAWRKKRRGDRRRRMAAVSSSMLATFALAVGGAAALGVDLPFVDDALDGLRAGREGLAPKSTEPGGDPRLPAMPADIKPGVNSKSPPLTIPWTEDGERAIGQGYVNRNDEICPLIVEPSGATAVFGCHDPEAVTAAIDDGVVYVAGVGVSDPITVIGYVDQQAEAVTVTGPAGGLTTRVTDKWVPGLENVEALRLFVATMPAPSQGQEVPADERDAFRDPAAYVVRVRLDDGRTVTVRQ
jgi:hypothetical protein